MIPAINHSHRFVEGTGQIGCMQTLRNFATRITNAIAQFFQRILPCIFKKKAEPVLQGIAPQPTPQLTVVQTTAPTTPQKPVQTVQITPPVAQQRVTQTVNTVAATVVQPVQQQQPHTPVQVEPPTVAPLEQQPAVVIQLPPEPQGNINALLSPRTEARTLKLNHLLNRTMRVLNYENIAQVARDTAVVVENEGKAQEIKDDDRNFPATSQITKNCRTTWGMSNIEIGQYLALQKVTGRHLKPSERKGAAFVVLEMLHVLWPFIAKGLMPSAEDLNYLVTEGLTKYQDKGSPEAPTLQLENILKDDYPSLVRAPIGRRNSLSESNLVSFAQKSLADQIVNILINNAKNQIDRLEAEEDMFGAILAAGEPNENPPVYGVFIKTHRKVDHSLYPPGVSYEGDIYLLDLYGGGMGTVFLTKISRNILVNLLSNKSRYSCIAFKEVTE